jgi:hypothetical protein
MILSELRAGCDDPTNPTLWDYGALVFPYLLKLSFAACRKSIGSYHNDFSPIF